MYQNKSRTPRGTCAITGGNGFVGQALSNYLQNIGWNVVQIGRSKPQTLSSNCSDINFSLGDELDPNCINGIDALVHCAYDYSLTKWSDINKTNIEGTERLFKSAYTGGITNILYISSISAFPSAVSSYGRAKYTCETLARQYQGTSIRVGLVFDGENRGTIGAIEKIVKSFPIIPLFMPKKRLYLCNRVDLCRCIDGLLLDSGRVDCITVANSEPLTFLDLIRAFQNKHQRIMPIIVFPWRLVWLLIRISEFFGLRLPIRSDAILGFIHQNNKPDFMNFKEHNFPIRNDVCDV